MIFPVHPRTEKMIEAFGLDTDGLRFVPPLPYLEFIQLQRHASLILTDSGGLQEEACFLRVPCVTLRENTERQSTVTVGSNILAGTDQERIVRAARVMMARKREWTNPYGNGRSGEQTLEVLLSDGAITLPVAAPTIPTARDTLAGEEIL